MIRPNLKPSHEICAHTDAGELLAWLRTAPRPPGTCLLGTGSQHAAQTQAE